RVSKSRISRAIFWTAAFMRFVLMDLFLPFGLYCVPPGAAHVGVMFLEDRIDLFHRAVVESDAQAGGRGVVNRAVDAVGGGAEFCVVLFGLFGFHGFIPPPG